jgi:hypothetical protein
MKVLVSNGRSDPSRLCDVLFCPHVSFEQISKGDQIREAHHNTGPNNGPILYHVILKQGLGVWPYLSEGQNCEYARVPPLKREMKWSIAEHFRDAVGINYGDVYHSISSLFDGLPRLPIAHAHRLWWHGVDLL